VAPKKWPMASVSQKGGPFSTNADQFSKQTPYVAVDLLSVKILAHLKGVAKLSCEISQE